MFQDGVPHTQSSSNILVGDLGRLLDDHLGETNEQILSSGIRLDGHPHENTGFLGHPHNVFGPHDVFGIHDALHID